MQWVKDLVHRYKGAPTTIANLTTEGQLDGVKSGTIALTTDQSTRLSSARSGEGIGLNLATDVIPSFEAGKPSPTGSSGWTLAIGKYSKNREARLALHRPLSFQQLAVDRREGVVQPAVPERQRCCSPSSPAAWYQPSPFSCRILVYASWLTPITTWTLRGFFERVPMEIEEAALVDGCSRLRAFYTIVVPLTLPGLAAAGVYIFLETWNEFLIAVSLTSIAEKRLLTVGLYQYVTSFGVEWGLLTAAALVALLPVLIPFLSMQKLFVSGLTAGAVKE